MDKLHIVYVDDQREVLSALEKDLELFESHISVEECESADEALEVINEIDKNGDQLVAIICDHVMPGKTGVDFLAEINKDDRFIHTKKILLTGQATHQDTIKAINEAGIDKYFEKPWASVDLIITLKIMITEFLFEKGINHIHYAELLHQETLLQLIRKDV